ncbi:MAG: hypothetical protein H7A44_08310 [Opitutaceae bacterium]|nr:hypothetical protein [Opitutaceae bacterium]
MAYSFNSAYLDSVGANPDEDTYVDSRNTLDTKITYRLTPHISVFGEFTNITEQPLRNYFGIPSRPTATRSIRGTPTSALTGASKLQEPTMPCRRRPSPVR